MTITAEAGAAVASVRTRVVSAGRIDVPKAFSWLGATDIASPLRGGHACKL